MTVRNRKIIIPLSGENVSPRFDLATEVVIVEINGRQRNDRMIMLPSASSERLCQLILTEGADTVVCGGIEDEYYQYLTWKKIDVFDSVAGPWEAAVSRLVDGSLSSGEILFSR